MSPRKSIFFTLGVLLSSACTTAQAAPTPTPQPSATYTLAATSDPTPSPTPTQTPTPEVAQPAVGHDLSSVNAAEMVLEGDVWVVKNGAGEVTARWDESAQIWNYEGEAIQMQIALVGNPTENIQVPPEMIQFMPDDPVKHLNNNGVPIPDGTIVDWDIKRGGGEGAYVQPTAYTAVRIRGVFREGQIRIGGPDRHLMVFEIRLSPDQSIMLLRGVFDLGQGIATFRILPGGDISLLDLDPFSETFSPVIGVTGPGFIEYIEANVGNQILFGIRHDFPDFDSGHWENESLEQLLASIRAGEMPSQSVLDSLNWGSFFGGDFVVRE